jgi:hypothetical protein
LFQESRKNTAISALILPRERELSLAHVQRCSFLIIEQGCGPMTVEIFPGNISDISTYFAKRTRAKFEHEQRCSFLIMEQSCSPLAVEFVLGKHCNFSTYLAKRTSVQSGACAEVQIPDYGTELSSTGSRKDSRKALRFQQLSCQVFERSVWSMRRGAVS